MFLTRIASVTIMLCIAAPSTAQEPDIRMEGALEKYRTGDLDAAMQSLEPLLAADDLDETSKLRARQLAIRVLHLRGEQHFREARIVESIADFDHELQLAPDRAAEHWQRGIAYYYAGQYEKGARQFELHRTVNPQDVENAAWHFLCIVRAQQGSVELAQQKLIPVTDDPRVPMDQIQQMFAGKLPPDDVLKAGQKAGRRAKFYADLYVGLYFEALGREKESLRLINLAADNPVTKDSYMGDVARVHVKLHMQQVDQRTKSLEAKVLKDKLHAD